MSIAVGGRLSDRRVEVLTREGCHLCDRLEARLERPAARLGLAVVAVDVDDDAALRAAYGTRVPVVRTSNGRVLAEGDWGGVGMWLGLLRARFGWRDRSRN